MASVGIIGSGTRGAALSVLLSSNGHTIQMWSTIPQEIAELKDTRIHRNPPEVRILEAIGLAGDLEEAVRDKDLLVLVVPSVFVRQTSQRVRLYIKQGQVITNVAGGIEEKNLITLSQTIGEGLPEAEVAVLFGSSHAEEVSKGFPITCMAGTHKRSVAEFVQGILTSEVFRVYTNPDVLGIEPGGAPRNVVTLAVGMANGLGYGDNTKTALITRGIAEISHPGVNMGGRMETFTELTGIGGLIMTCASMHSRDRRASILVGQGHTMEKTTAEVKMVVEGMHSVRAALTLSWQCGVSMPIVEQVNAILPGGMPAEEAVLKLMPRDKRIENSDLEWVEE